MIEKKERKEREGKNKKKREKLRIFFKKESFGQKEMCPLAEGD